MNKITLTRRQRVSAILFGTVDAIIVHPSHAIKRYLHNNVAYPVRSAIEDDRRRRKALLFEKSWRTDKCDWCNKNTYGFCKAHQRICDGLIIDSEEKRMEGYTGLAIQEGLDEEYDPYSLDQDTRWKQHQANFAGDLFGITKQPTK